MLFLGAIMAEGLEKEYYKLPQEDFSKLLESIRNDPRTCPLLWQY